MFGKTLQLALKANKPLWRSYPTIADLPISGPLVTQNILAFLNDLSIFGR